MTSRLPLTVVALALVACNPTGGRCRTTADCSEGDWCSFAFVGTPTCSPYGTCVEKSTCFDQNVYWPTTVPIYDDVSSVSECGCDGVTHYHNPICPGAPIAAYGVCMCTGLDVLDVHAGPRSLEEPCISEHGLSAPARCCDCSLVVSGPEACRSASGELLAANCCQCFTQTARDPTGRCGPPGGVWTSFTWCCPADFADAGSPDAG